MNKYKAVILAGGEGKRLRPLTSVLPKPLLQAAGKSLIERILDDLCDEGIKECIITLGYKGEEIKKHLRDSYKGIKLTYYSESIPLGSAGSVKAAEDELSDVFAVICGDEYYEFDIMPAFSLLEKKNADCVIITTDCRNPLEYGIVKSDDDGRITGFIEKPSWSGVISGRINTGIYIMKKSLLGILEKDKAADFSQDLFPVMLEKGMTLLSYHTEGKWCDIGNPKSFYDINMYLSGKDNVIGSNCAISGLSSVVSSVIGNGVKIRSGSRLTSCIIDSKCEIGNDVKIGEGCVVGAGSRIGDGAVLGKGVILPPGCDVKAFSVLDNPLWNEDIFSVRKLTVIGNIREKMNLIGRSIGSLGGKGKIAVGYERGVSSLRNTVSQFLFGLCRTSENVVFIGGTSYSEIRLAAIKREYSLTVFLQLTSLGIDIHFFDENGLYPGAGFERRLRYASMFSYYLPDAGHEHISSPQTDIYNYSEAFNEALDGYITSEISDIRVCLLDSSLSPLSAYFSKKGMLCDERSADMVIRTLDDGECEGAEIIYDGIFFDADHIRAICLFELINRGENEILLPYRSPDALRDIVLRSGCSLSLFSLSRQNVNDPGKNRLFRKMLPLFDGCFAAVAFINYVNSMDLSGFGLYSLIPDFSTRRASLFLPEKYNTALISGKKCDGEGFIINSRRGKIRIIPENGGNLTLLAEASDIADASFLIDAAKKYVNGFAEDREKNSR